MVSSTKSRKSPPRPALPEGVEDYGAFQRRFWAAQRTAWIAFALILLACLLGLLGRGGIFATNTIETSGGTIEIPAISRWNAPEEMRVTLAASDKDQTIFVDSRFLESFSIEGIDPPQKGTLQKDGRIGYVVSSDPAAQAKILFRLRTQQPGLRSFLVGIGDDIAEHSAFILP